MTKGVKEPARLNGQAEEWIPVRHEPEDEVVVHDHINNLNHPG